MRQSFVLVLLGVCSGCSTVDDRCLSACFVLHSCYPGDSSSDAEFRGYFNLDSGIDGFSLCPEQCTASIPTGAHEALLRCTQNVSIPDRLDSEGDCTVAPEGKRTCGQMLDCLQTEYDLPHEATQTVTVRVAAASEAQVDGQIPTCEGGECGSLDCQATEWVLPGWNPPPVPDGICDALGTEELWLAFEPEQEAIQQSVLAPCQTALEDGASFTTNGGRVVVSLLAPGDPVRGEGTTDGKSDCRLLSRGAVDVPHGSGGVTVALPLRPVEQLISDGASATACPS